MQKLISANEVYSTGMFDPATLLDVSTISGTLKLPGHDQSSLGHGRMTEPQWTLVPAPHEPRALLAAII